MEWAGCHIQKLSDETLTVAEDMRHIITSGLNPNSSVFTQKVK